jgi:formate dehydrogenase subunit gamma
MTTLSRLCRTALALCAALGFGAVQAQTATGDENRIQKQQERRIEQPGNNAPVWREVRSGNEGYTSLKGREMGVLVQSGGETWRQIRNGPITLYGGWLLIIAALAIAAFFVTRGALKLHGKPTGKLIERFNSIERVTHWCVAISFVILAVSGLILLFGKHLLLPVIGYTLFAWLSVVAKNLHNFVGPFFILSLLVMVVIYIKDNFWSADDATWIAKAGGLFTGAHVPSGRFNFGEKGWFWVGAVMLGIAVSISGVILLFPNFDQVRSTMQIAAIVHGVAGIFFMALSIAHIYMGTIGVEGAYQSMRTGFVDETWAKEHHELWYREKQTGKRPQASGGAVPAGAPHSKNS